MFYQYFQMAHRLRKHYLSPRVLLCLLTGKFVPPINRKNLYSLQYSMLPAKRASITEMWNMLNASKQTVKSPGPVFNSEKHVVGNTGLGARSSRWR
jgi:phosphatidylinositol glycan class Q protein